MKSEHTLKAESIKDLELHVVLVPEGEVSAPFAKPSPYRGIDQAVMVYTKEFGMSRLSMPKEKTLPEELQRELWDIAMANTEDACIARRLDEYMAEIMGIHINDAPENFANNMVIVTNTKGMGGAGCILTKTAKDEIKKILKGYEKAIIIPSSRDEMLAVGKEGQMTLEDITITVDIVNSEEVSDDLVLGHEAYEVDLNNWE